MPLTHHLVQIRPATPADVPHIAHIEKQLQAGTAWTETQLQAAFGENSLNLVAMLDDVVIGYAVCQYVCDEAELHLIGVAKNQQRQGFAAALLTTLLAALAEKHICRLFLEVRASNTAAICLYEKHGFEQVGIRKNYYRQINDQQTNGKKTASSTDKNVRENAIIMQKSV